MNMNAGRQNARDSEATAVETQWGLCVSCIVRARLDTLYLFCIFVQALASGRLGYPNAYRW